jgi:hypothetical protein
MQKNRPRGAIILQVPSAAKEASDFFRKSATIDDVVDAPWSMKIYSFLCAEKIQKKASHGPRTQLSHDAAMQRKAITKHS